MLSRFLSGALFAASLVVFSHALFAADTSRPNVFIAISDDQSYPHASAYGSAMVDSPNFDRVAREGILFTNAFCASPGCSPSRAAFLTGLNTWQLEHAGTHASYFDPKFETFPDRFAAAGYHVGHTGKGWGPGNFKELGREHNPAGPSYSGKGKKDGVHNYSSAFESFLEANEGERPFCFWFGSTDPHRGYAKGSGLEKGKTLDQAEVPEFLPDVPEIRSDMLDFAFEVERFDEALGEMLKIMEREGLLDNTLVIITSDNGTPIPRAKANCYEAGIHMPLAIRLPDGAHGGRTVDDLVGFTDLTATLYDLAGVDPPSNHSLVGRSIRNLLESDASGILDTERTAVYSARERHSSSRFNTLSYPQRCIRTRQYLLIHNFKPERWPAGPAQKYASVVYDEVGNVTEAELGPPHGAYHDIDACPTLDYLIAHRDDPKVARYLELAVGIRPAEELYDITRDRACLNNLADDPHFADVRRQLHDQLFEYLQQTGDARVAGDGDVWETYPRVSGLRWFPKPQWAEQNPESVPEQEWLEKRRPRAE